MPNVAMVVSTVGYHWEEVAGAYREFSKLGSDIRIFTITGAAPQADPVSLKFTGLLSLAGYGISRAIGPNTQLGQEIQTALAQAQTIDTLDAKTIDILYLPGGHGCLFDMNRNPKLHQKILEIYEHGGILSGVCHATSTFSFVRLHGKAITQNKRITGFPHTLDRLLVKAGAVSPQFLPIPFSNDESLIHSGARLGVWNQLLAALYPAYARVDPPFVTGMGPKASASVARKAIALLRK